MLSRTRFFSAAFLGCTGALFIWFVTPYNNFLLQNSYISDTYFPVAAVICTLVLVLVVNPCLKLLKNQWALSTKQFALIFSILLIASVTPSQGLLRMLPWALAQSTVDSSRSIPLSRAMQNADLPPSLFPDPIGYDEDVPNSEQFLDELLEGRSLPWDAWGPVSLSWGLFFLSCSLLMVGTGLALLPHWQQKERLPFPLIDVYRSILPQSNTTKRLLPPLFYDRLFWVGAGTVLFLYALNGLHLHTGDQVPGFPMGWNISNLFSEPPWRYLSRSITKVEHIYFVLVGMAFFMPNRISFSIWFTTIGYGVYTMLQKAYTPAPYGGFVHDHRNGAMLAIACIALYLSRHHWRKIASVMIRPCANDSDRFLKSTGWMLTTGAVGLFIWLKWAGVSYLWAAGFVAIGFLASVLIARVVAETGLPFIRVTGLNPTYFMAMLPATTLTAASIYLAGFISMIFSQGSRVSAAVMASHAASVDPDATPAFQRKLSYAMIIILILGFIIGGAIHLNMGYRHATALDSNSSTLNDWGSTRLRDVQRDLVRWTDATWSAPSERFHHFSVGIILASILQIACMNMPRWPLHPIGMVMVGHYYGNMAWASIFFGWLLKTTIIKYGGATLFRKAKPLFLGFIIGEILSAVIWTLVPVILIWLGQPPSDVVRMHILPT